MSRSLQTLILLCAAGLFTDSAFSSVIILLLQALCVLYMCTADRWEREIRDIERRMERGNR